MHPTFHLGPIDFPAYFTLLTIGYTAAVLLAWRESWHLDGVDPDKFLDFSILMLLTGLLGARLLHVVADGYFWDYVHLCTDPLKTTGRHLGGGAVCTTDAQCVQHKIGELCNTAVGTCHQGRDCLRVFKIWYGGLAFYGGLLAAIPVGALYMHKHRDKLKFWRVADLGGFGISLGLVFGRIGCWFAGCCFGKTTGSAIGVVFPKFSPAWDRQIEEHLISGAAVHPLAVLPTELFHAGSNLLIFIVTFVMFKRYRKFDGIVFWTFMVLYATSRFILEFWRDDHRGVWLGNTLSTSQLIGIPIIIAAFWAAFWFWLRQRKTHSNTDA